MLHDISFPTWRRIFSLGFNFLELKPWEWMEEDMMFAVVQPENGAVGYCVILGNSHPIQGLAVYKGARGLYNYLAHWKEEQKVNITDCMLLSFGDLDQFWEQEKELFEWLEIEEKEQYPLVRDYQTGMETWPLEDEESARLMMFAMEQSISMAIRFKSERVLQSPIDSENYRMLFRVPYQKGAMLLWKDQWNDVKEDYLSGSMARANKLFLRSNCGMLPQHAHKKWMLQVFLLPNQRKPLSQRPYHPYALIVIDPAEESFIGEFMFHPPELQDQLQIRIKDLLVFEGYIPGEFQIVGKQSFAWMEGIARELGVRTTLQEKEPEILKEMKDRLTQE